MIKLISIIACLIIGCATEPQVRFKDFRLENASDKDIFGYYQFGETKGTVGIVAAGTGKSKGFAPFKTSQKAKIHFKCDLDDPNPCAAGQIDVSKYYPKGNYEIITTIFTFIENNKIELSFRVKSYAGSSEIIRIGELEKE